MEEGREKESRPGARRDGVEEGAPGEGGDQGGGECLPERATSSPTRSRHLNLCGPESFPESFLVVGIGVGGSHPRSLSEGQAREKRRR